MHHARAIGAAVARFPDTEEVTGSNPVSPTNITAGQRIYPDFVVLPHGISVELGRPPKAVRLRRLGWFRRHELPSLRQARRTAFVPAIGSNRSPIRRPWNSARPISSKRPSPWCNATYPTAKCTSLGRPARVSPECAGRSLWESGSQRDEVVAERLVAWATEERNVDELVIARVSWCPAVIEQHHPLRQA